MPYHAYLYCPVRGKRYDLGLVVNTGKAGLSADKLKKLRTLYAKVDKGLPLVMHDDPYNPRVWAVELPEIHLLKDGDFKLERLPAPQDWVMVLEKVQYRDLNVFEDVGTPGSPNPSGAKEGKITGKM